MKRGRFGEQVEQLLEAVINGIIPKGSGKDPISRLAQDAYAFECRNTRVVAFGGEQDFLRWLAETLNLRIGPTAPLLA